MENEHEIFFSLNEINCLLEILDTQYHAIPSLFELSTEERTKLYNTLNEFPDSEVDYMENQMAEWYNLIPDIVKKIEEFKKDVSNKLMMVLFPTRQMDSLEYDHVENEELETRKKFIVEALQMRKKGSTCEHLGNVFLYGIKLKDKIAIIESKNFTRFEYFLETPKP